MSAVENVKLALSATGHVVSATLEVSGAQTHRVIAKADPGERLEWEVDYTIKSFSHISFHLQVRVVRSCVPCVSCGRACRVSCVSC